VRVVNTSTGEVTTLAGNAMRGLLRDGSELQSLFLFPRGLSWDAAASTLYVADDTAIRAVRSRDAEPATALNLCRR